MTFAAFRARKFPTWGVFGRVFRIAGVCSRTGVTRVKFPTTFATVTAGRHNNFDALRFLLATAVVYTHSLIFTNVHGIDPLEWLSSGSTFVGQQAVNGFFIISGCLIAASWSRSGSAAKFFKNRVLRIHPGFIAASLLCLLVVGPIEAADAHAYFAGIRFPRAAANMLLLNKIETNVDINGGPWSLNGSLWTIKIEFECYILVALLAWTGLLRKKPVAVLLLACLVAFALLSFPALSNHLPRRDQLLHFGSHVQFVGHFLAGVLFYLAKDVIPVSRAFLAASLLAIFVATVAQHLTLVTPIFGSYVVFYAAYDPKIQLANFAKHGDLSYGVYLYGWPVQLLMTHVLGWEVNPYLFFVVCMPFVCAVAYGSWHLVEKKFLKLKGRTIAAPVATRQPTV